MSEKVSNDAEVCAGDDLEPVVRPCYCAWCGWTGVYLDNVAYDDDMPGSIDFYDWRAPDDNREYAHVYRDEGDEENEPSLFWECPECIRREDSYNGTAEGEKPAGYISRHETKHAEENTKLLSTLGRVSIMLGRAEKYCLIRDERIHVQDLQVKVDALMKRLRL